MKPVLTKQDFVKRYKLGEFGNRSPTWTIRDWLTYSFVSQDPRLYHLRNKEVGGETHYNLSSQELCKLLDKINALDWHYWYISEMAPTEKTLVQGEVQRCADGLYFRYTFERLPMRDALASSQGHAWRIEATMLLKKYLCSNSYEQLCYLLDTYEDHVIEISTYSVNWGTNSGFNTVFWEVRNY